MLRGHSRSAVCGIERESFSPVNREITLFEHEMRHKTLIDCVFNFLIFSGHLSNVSCALGEVRWKYYSNWHFTHESWWTANTPRCWFYDLITYRSWSIIHFVNKSMCRKCITNERDTGTLMLTCLTGFMVHPSSAVSAARWAERHCFFELCPARSFLIGRHPSGKVSGSDPSGLQHCSTSPLPVITNTVRHV